MARISIIDSGYLQTNVVTGVQATQVNSGSAIAIKNAELVYEGDANLDTQPRIGSNSSPNAGFGSLNAAKITMDCVLDRNDSADMDALVYIEALRSTYGVKLLYYSDATDAKGIVQKLGETNQSDVHITPFFGGTNTPHLHVRVKGVRFVESTTSHIRYKIDMVTT